MATSERPVTVRRTSHVPGGFELDDELSPIKTTFDDDNMAVLDEAPERTLAETERDSKYVTDADGSSEYTGENETFLQEKEMRRRLDDFDSSFLQAVEPLTPAAGGDLSGISEESAQSDAVTAVAESSEEREEGGTDEDKGSNTASENFYTPAPGRTEPSSPTQEETLDGESHANISALETMSSSPAAAAAARTISRTVSGTSAASESLGESRGGVPIEPEQTPKGEKSFASPESSPTPTKTSHKAPDMSPRSPSPQHRRPTYLHNRIASGRSSYSSQMTTSTEGASDVTLGADFALQSGGAVPERGSLISRPSDFTRTISLGSVNSVFSGNDEGRMGDGQLPTLAEDPITPFAGRKVSNPTDTVINRHVENIAVPETVARQYRAGQRETSPDKRSAAGRNVNNLTLKEQSNTIDKLMKVSASHRKSPPFHSSQSLTLQN